MGWRDSLQPASFRGAGFFVEIDSQQGGRRNATHEFPKQDTPWTEDMGRKARRWNVTGYVIVSPLVDDYQPARDALIDALEQSAAGSLVHPLLGTSQANVDDYVVTEVKDKGGYARFEMRFVEAGQQPGTVVTDDTQSQVNSSATTAGSASSSSLDTSLQSTIST